MNCFVHSKDPKKVMLFAEEDFSLVGAHTRMQFSENQYVSMFGFSYGHLSCW